MNKQEKFNLYWFLNSLLIAALITAFGYFFNHAWYIKAGLALAIIWSLNAMLVLDRWRVVIQDNTLKEIVENK